MNKLIKFDINLKDISLNRNSLAFNVKQFDDLILEVGVLPTFPTNQTITLYGYREDKQVIKQSDNITISDNKLYVKLSNSFTCVEGICKLEFEFIDEEGRTSSDNVAFHVKKRLGNENAFEVVTVEQLKSHNSIAKENIDTLLSENGVARENISQLIKNIELGNKLLLELKENLQLVGDVTSLYSDVKELKDNKNVLRTSTGRYLLGVTEQGNLTTQEL